MRCIKLMSSHPAAGISKNAGRPTQGVPFFFKQWGGVRKAKNGRLLDGRAYDEYPNRVVGQVPDRSVCQQFAMNFAASFRSGPGRPLVQIPV